MRGPVASASDEPRLTYVLIAICVIVFLGSGQFGVQSSTDNSLFTNGALIGYGRLDGDLIGVYFDQYWRLITGGFLHAGFIHIAFNMYLLWWLGRMLEPINGTGRFAAIYFTSLLCGSMGALILEPNTFTVGASGAIFGLMGAALIELRNRGHDMWRNEIMALIVLNLVLSFVISGVSIGGHIGGLLGGLLVAFLIGQADRQGLPRWSAYAICAVVAAVAIAGSLIASVPPGA